MGERFLSPLHTFIGQSSLFEVLVSLGQYSHTGSVVLATPLKQDVGRLISKSDTLFSTDKFNLNCWLVFCYAER